MFSPDALAWKWPVPGHARLPEGADPNDSARYARGKGQDYSVDHMIDMG